MKISKDKQYKTRSGLAVVILADNVPGNKYPVSGYTIDSQGYTSHHHWTNDGKFYANDDDTDDLDLFPAPVVTVEFGAIWDHDHAQGMTRWSTEKQQYHNCIGHMVRTTEEGKRPVYHFEPKRSSEGAKV